MTVSMFWLVQQIDQCSQLLEKDTAEIIKAITKILSLYRENRSDRLSVKKEGLQVKICKSDMSLIKNGIS